MSEPTPTMAVVASFDEIGWLKGNSPAWRLLSAANAPLVLSFLHKVFVEENVRSIPATELAGRLDDELYALNERSANERTAAPQFPKSARAYLHPRPPPFSPGSRRRRRRCTRTWPEACTGTRCGWSRNEWRSGR